MRKCLRCGCDMAEDMCFWTGTMSMGGKGNFLAKTDVSFYPMVQRNNLFSRNAVARIKMAVCPDCGYAEFYVDDEKFRAKLKEDG